MAVGGKPFPPSGQRRPFRLVRVVGDVHRAPRRAPRPTPPAVAGWCGHDPVVHHDEVRLTIANDRGCRMPTPTMDSARTCTAFVAKSVSENAFTINCIDQ